MDNQKYVINIIDTESAKKQLGVNPVDFLKHHENINKICAPLFSSSSIEYFAYQQFSASRQYSFIASHPDLALYMIDNDNYLDSWWFSIPFENLASGLTLWDLCKTFSNQSQAKMTQEIIKFTGLTHGIDILYKKNDFVEIFTYASGDSSMYHYPVSKLHQFRFYFYEQARHYIEALNDIKLNLVVETEPLRAMPILPSTGTLNSSESTFEASRYYFCGYDHYLTPTEYQCLLHIYQGLTSKEIARILNISYRTVEKHIANMREKLGVNSVLEMMRKASRLHLINCETV